jgi:SAM-dependent methyltransferase
MAKKNYGQITGFASPFLESIRIKKITSVVKGGDILDYGCGYGKFCEVISFKTYTGVDVDSSIISDAKERYSDIKNVTFYSIDEFGTRLEQYDFIILSAVLEHVKDPLLLLKLLKDHLRGSGKIVITTPTHFGNSLLDVGSKAGIFSRQAFEEHNQILSKKNFEEIAEILDFKGCKYSTFECGMNQMVVFSLED